MRFPEDSEFVCVIGWDEALYREALSWVDAVRRVAIVSESERASDDPRVKIYLLESPLQMEAIARKIGWSAVLRNMAVIGEGPLKKELERCHLAAGLILSEAAGYWIKPMENARANQMAYRRGIALAGAFAGIPAIIVGAGPSLKKNGRLLSAFAKRALIFAGGSALNEIDMEPHFGGAIDAEAPYRQFKIQPFSEIPFCYQSRMSRDNASLVHGERLLFPDSSSDPINWIHGEERFDGGWTVGNFLTAAAVHMGCSPIVFVGMDLCYEEGRKYAQIEAEIPEGLIQARGKMTQRDWLMGAEWTEKMAEGRDFINATEGGLLALPAEKLSDVLKRCPIEKDLRVLVHETMQRLPLSSSGERWKEWDLSLRNCKKKGVFLEDEVVYQKLLLPLWEIWRPVFEREVEMDPRQKLEVHRSVFFQTVLEEHGSILS
ncbi:MAG: 6-hydroxymethylpterin diphosphokinase MptE-like protein [Chlamydiales bacterium]